MEEIKKIYKVYAGELVEIEVEKVTNKLVWVEPSEYLGFSRKLDKDYVCVTPQEAIQEELNRALTAVGMYSDRLKVAQDRVKAAKTLKADKLIVVSPGYDYPILKQ